MGGKPPKRIASLREVFTLKTRQGQLEEAMHKDWVVLRWDSLNERNFLPSIVYAVIGEGYCVVNRAWFHETAGWCPHGGTIMTLFLDDVEKLQELMKSDAKMLE